MRVFHKNDSYALDCMEIFSIQDNPSGQGVIVFGCIGSEVHVQGVCQGTRGIDLAQGTWQIIGPCNCQPHSNFSWHTNGTAEQLAKQWKTSADRHRMRLQFIQERLAEAEQKSKFWDGAGLCDPRYAHIDCNAKQDLKFWQAQLEETKRLLDATQ